MSIHKNQSEPGQFEIILARTTHGSGTYSMHLQVVESCSRTTLVDVQLDAEQYMKLMSASHLTVESEPIDHPERIGKKMEVSSISYGTTQKRAAIETRLHALKTKRWDTAEVRRQNTGWLLVLKRWR